jgi:virginiamycin A acetyltransferase
VTTGRRRVQSGDRGAVATPLYALPIRSSSRARGHAVRRLLKHAAYGVAMVVTSPLWLLYRLQSALTGRERAFYDASQGLSLFPGIVGDYLRYGFYRLTLAALGEDACICFGATLSHPDIRIGRGTYVGPHCNLGLCRIGDDVLLGTGVHVLSGFGQHGWADLTVPIREQLGELLVVEIGDDTWIGNAAVVGNHVGTKCVVGAAAVVVHPVPPWSVAVGNPARVVRDRRAPQDGPGPGS